jgi:hypothetical protein
MLGAPVGFVTADAGSTWKPSTDVAKGFGGAVSGDQIHHLGDGKSYAYVSEFNAYTNGTKCSHGDVSPQCSGVLLTRDGGYTYEHIDWGGTDGAGTDASSGAFPSPDVWYVAGGFVQSCSGGPLCFKAYITKTTDGGKTFKTVHNVTATAADAGAGVGSMTDISCVDEETCFAVSACDQTACADGIYASNHSHGYGGYIHRTTDGGDTWAILHFEYEMAMAHVQAISKDEVWACGGSVGIIGHPSCWHTTDGGATWTEVMFEGEPKGSALLGLSMLPDGSTGFATTCNTLSNYCGVFKYVPAVIA